MKPRIPFRIGYQYSNWEKDLDASVPDRIPDNKMNVSYLWIGKSKPFLNYHPDRTELIFYWDRLSAVILTFEQRDMKYCEELTDALKEKFSLSEMSGEENVIIHKYMGNDVEYWCIFVYPNTITVIYGNKENICYLFQPCFNQKQ